MTAQEVFQKQFAAFTVTTRAALVFRYRENLPLAHVAQLVDRPAEKLGQHLDQVLVQLRDTGALTPSDAGADTDADAAAGEPSVEVLRQRLEELRGDPALSAFSLVCAVRAKQQQRRRLFGGWIRRGFA